MYEIDKKLIQRMCEMQDKIKKEVEKADRIIDRIDVITEQKKKGNNLIDKEYKMNWYCNIHNPIIESILNGYRVGAVQFCGYN